MGLGRRSLALARENGDDRAVDDPDIEPSRVITHVVAIHLDALAKGALVAARHLPEASDPRWDQPEYLRGGTELAELVHGIGAWTDDAHLAPEDVDQLRQLVETAR